MPVASVPDEVVHEHGFEDVGLVVVDRARPGVVLTHAPHAIFTSASLVKLLLAFEALDRGEPASDVHTMLATSHDPLASRLWVRYDGPRLVTSWAQRLDLRHTVPPERPAMWGDTLTTAADTVAVYDHLLRDAPPRTRDVVLSALQASTPRGHDGFDQRFGIPDAALRHGLSFAVKQGWACCTDHRVLHTTGVVGEGAEPDRWLVAVLTRSPRSVDYTTASANVTEFVTEVLGTAGVRHG
ncbi:serine hydrolase [Saccharomonospora sp. NB11]|uniref:serine hydrolase n=1 Tax=Saccharomonospora sp. NB11 TaxID=1642298 RepID=UPI0027DDFEF0|nr:serine hydrolase [Saccharomonospora sp. NB11]